MDNNSYSWVRVNRYYCSADTTFLYGTLRLKKNIDISKIFHFRLIFGNIALYMVCRKRNQQIYYGTRPTTHLVPVASAPVCIDDVDHSVTIVGRRQTKNKSSNRGQTENEVG